MDCPSSQDLVDFADGIPKAGILEHLESCADCRAEVAAVLPALPKRRKAWIPLLAAAAVLLAATLLPRSSPKPTPPSAPPVSASDPFVAAREIPFGRSALLTLREGARAEVKGNRVLWRAGDLCVDSRGEEVVLEWPGERLSFRDATVVLVDAPSTLSWLAEARASTGPSVFLVRGEAGTLPLSQAPWNPSTGWHTVPGGRIRDGLLPLGNPAGDFEWEALVRRPDERALFGAVWPGWKFPLGYGAVGPAGAWIRLRLERRQGWTRLVVGPVEVLRASDRDLAAKAYSSDSDSPGIYAWGGDVEVAEARWR